jgi:hypothetical protein
VIGTLEERVARLESVEAIHALKARYARLVDQIGVPIDGSPAVLLCALARETA